MKNSNLKDELKINLKKKVLLFNKRKRFLLFKYEKIKLISILQKYRNKFDNILKMLLIKNSN